MNLARGAIILVDLNPTVGHEQRGIRPCIVVSEPAVTADQRFPLLCVVPITGSAGEGILYPALLPGSNGLAKASWVLVDHLRSVDKRRVLRTFGSLTPAELSFVDEGLAVFLGLTGRGETAGAPFLHFA